MLRIRKLKITIPLVVIFVTVNIGIVIAASANEQQSDGNTSENVNLRKAPLSAKSFTDRVYDGNRLGLVTIDPEKWDKTKTLNGLLGVVYSDLLNSDLNEKASMGKLEEEREELIKKQKAEEEKNRFKEKDGWIDATDLNIRQTMSISGKSMGVLDKGDKVRLLDEKKDKEGNVWYQIKTSDNKTGWIYSKYISLTIVEKPKSSDSNSSSTGTTGTTGSSDTGTTSSSSAKGEEIAAYARQYLGYPYVYGGTTTSGFDCSGFVNYVYNHFGISLPRTTYDIAVQGQSVSFANLQPGDVLCFTSDGGSIGHVGIYLGNSEFIHAQSSNTGVVISSIASGENYNTRFSSGRRFIN
ncbi:MAG: SH3 domain-containing C40 family peptidase [Clostridiales bacterium]